MSSFKDHWHGQVRKCAKGFKQYAFVNELLESESYYTLEPIPGKPWAARVPVYGTARLEARSYKNLEKRLKAAGFNIVEEESSEKYIEAVLRLI